MKKIALILSLLMIFSLVFVACGDDKKEESKPAGSTAESTVESKEESKEESKPADQSEVESETGSEASSEAEPTSEDTPDVSVDVTGATNVVAGLTYTISGDGQARRGGEWNEHYDADLTDGKYADAVANEDGEDGKGLWFGFNANSNVTDGKASITFTFDEAKTINDVRVHVGQQKDWGISFPSEMFVEISTDGTNFTRHVDLPIAELSTKAGEANYVDWVEAGFEAVEVKAVRVSAYVVGTWFFLNEIEVYEAAE